MAAVMLWLSNIVNTSGPFPKLTCPITWSDDNSEKICFIFNGKSTLQALISDNLNNLNTCPKTRSPFFNFNTNSSRWWYVLDPLDESPGPLVYILKIAARDLLSELHYLFRDSTVYTEIHEWGILTISHFPILPVIIDMTILNSSTMVPLTASVSARRLLGRNVCWCPFPRVIRLTLDGVQSMQRQLLVIVSRIWWETIMSILGTFAPWVTG